MSIHAANYHYSVRQCQHLSVLAFAHNSDMDDLASRLISARTAAGLNQTELARLIGARQSVIGMLESRARKKTTYLTKLANVLGVSAAWLDSGDGPREPPLQEPDAAPYFPDDESRLLRAFRLASPEIRRSLLRQADGILEDLENPSQLTGDNAPSPG